MYRIGEVYQKIYNEFLKNNFDSARIETEVIITKTLGIDKSVIYSFPEKKLSVKQIEKILKNFSLRIAHFPMEYIFCEKEFFGLKFYVDHNVLIPRPETELLVEEALSLIERNGITSFADIGTGSGNIVISILKNIKTKLKEVFATDLYENVLKVAIKNAKNYGLLEKIKFILTDKLKYFIDNKIKLELIISNPPYVTLKEYKNLQKEIYYEPSYALVTLDGLKFYRYFSANGKKVVKEGGYLILEINPNLFTKICDLFTNESYRIYKIIYDYQKLPRGIVIEVLK
ncbi:MAG: peptide chain release factor N(5)-glutamine methyltransferase [Elusimicrobiota bacterium]|nr:peptide chain release factor N(5)-glutamine methyltransferase [Endomicrobiia bacterium]MDW8164885.1 peptide chain release factor N(5)-glutamine methyltransferase [Elusimicrobiota bacterium]